MKHYTAKSLKELARQLQSWSGQFVELGDSMLLNEIQGLPETNEDQVKRAKGTFRTFIKEVEDAILDATREMRPVAAEQPKARRAIAKK